MIDNDNESLTFFPILDKPSVGQNDGFFTFTKQSLFDYCQLKYFKEWPTLSKILFFQEFFWMSLIMDSKAYLVGCCHFYRSVTWNLQEALKIALNHLLMTSEFFCSFQKSWEINHTKVLGKFFNVKPTLECVLEQQCKKPKVQVG